MSARALGPWSALLLAFIVGMMAALGSQAVGATQQPQTTNALLVDPVRLERAQRRLVQTSATLEGEVSLAHLLSLVLAPESNGRDTSLVDDHRAALFVAALFVNQWPIDRLVPDARTWPRPTPRRVTLGGRRDHAQHFALSAAMAAAVGTPLAEAVAVFKELRDAQGGSGFSFSDVLANRAGQRFGAEAAGSAPSALRLAERLRKRLSDSDIIPETADLPDNLTEQEFTRRFGSVGSPVYNKLVADIDARIGTLALYR